MKDIKPISEMSDDEIKEAMAALRQRRLSNRVAASTRAPKGQAAPPKPRGRRSRIEDAPEELEALLEGPGDSDVDLEDEFPGIVSEVDEDFEKFLEKQGPSDD